MLDISNSAAGLLDGDIMGRLQAEDEDTPEYQQQLRILRTFQDNIELEYIYGIRDMGDNTFTFTIDPAVDDPGEFGSPILTTDALIAASKGTPSVDNQAYTDEWGRFYSAYSPVFDSSGKVAGIVGVDFNADWFDSKLQENTRYILLVSFMSLIVGALVVLALTSQIRKKFIDLKYDVEKMATDLKQLTDEAKTISKIDLNYHLTDLDANSKAYNDNDDIDNIKHRISDMHKELKNYLSFAQMQAYKDSMTGVSNKTAYLELIHNIDKDIAAGNAKFSVVVFDINGLKKANDYFGHEEGDKIIVSTADVLIKAFGKDNIFRIGGDEFIAVLKDKNASDVEEYYKVMDQAIDEVNNSDNPLALPLSISRGMAEFTDDDTIYNTVFKRADDDMYSNKADYYREHSR